LLVELRTLVIGGEIDESSNSTTKHAVHAIFGNTTVLRKLYPIYSELERVLTWRKLTFYSLKNLKSIFH